MTLSSRYRYEHLVASISQRFASYAQLFSNIAGSRYFHLNKAMIFASLSRHQRQGQSDPALMRI
jgi:hypothetical protein